MSVNAVVAVPPEVVVCRASVRELPVPAVIVIDDAPPVILPTPVRLPVMAADPSKFCPHMARGVVKVATLVAVVALPTSAPVNVVQARFAVRR